jgi:hypothetical protein
LLRLRAGAVQRRQQDADQQRDDADDHEQFHQREASTLDTMLPPGNDDDL